MQKTESIYNVFEERMRKFLSNQATKVQLAVAKSFLSLIKLRNSIDNKIFVLQAMSSLNDLEGMLRLDHDSKSDQPNINLHTVKMMPVAILEFNEEEIKRLQKFLKQFIPSSDGQSLQEFIKDRLNCESEQSYSVRQNDGPALQLVNAMMAISNSTSEEDFSIHSDHEIEDSGLRSIIEDYYKEKGMSIKSDGMGGFNVMKEDKKKFWLCISNGGGVHLPLMITVNSRE